MKLVKPRIALIGRMGSGKSEIAKKFVEEFGAQRVALGDALKRQVINYGLVPDGVIDKVRDRATLQDWGQFRRGEIARFDFFEGNAARVKLAGKITYTGLGRNAYLHLPTGFYQDYWVDTLKPEVDKLIKNKRAIINDDIRRINEWQAFEKWGFFIVKVHCNEETRLKRLTARDGGYDSSRMEDISESEVDKLLYDFLLDNNDTFEKTWHSLLGMIC